MQFLILCCFDETQWEKFSHSERDRVMHDYGSLIQELKQSGQLLAGAKLNASRAAVTVREQNGKPAITDGPFAETKEQLGGYHLVECQDLDEALAIARRIPTLAVGGVVEVRPVMHLE